jgi:bacterioferritin-associated ferredoxin
MIVCCCKAVSDDLIKQLVSEGNDFQKIIDLTLATTDCGTCKVSLGVLYDFLQSKLKT